MRMFGSLKHGGDKSPLEGGSHYLLTSLWGAAGCGGVWQSSKIITKKKSGATEKGRGEAAEESPGGWELFRRSWREGEWGLVMREERRLLRLLLLLFSQTDERPACWAPRGRDVILKPNVSCAGTVSRQTGARSGVSDWGWQGAAPSGTAQSCTAVRDRGGGVEGKVRRTGWMYVWKTHSVVLKCCGHISWEWGPAGRE